MLRIGVNNIRRSSVGPVTYNIMRTFVTNDINRDVREP